MPISDFLKNIRGKVGHDLLILPSVTVIHFDGHGRMLLMRHGGTGKWVAPGGSIEPNETPADAAVREMWEETGLSVKLTRILGVFGGPDFLVEYTNGDSVIYVMTVFECKVTGGSLQPHDSETLELAYFSKDELSTLELASWARVVLPSLFDHDPSAIFQPACWAPPVKEKGLMDGNRA